MRHARQIERWKRMSDEEKLLAFVALMEWNHRAFLSLPRSRRERIAKALLARHEREEGHSARRAPARFWGNRRPTRTR